jgi:hypothetical protein
MSEAVAAPKAAGNGAQAAGQKPANPRPAAKSPNSANGNASENGRANGKGPKGGQGGQKPPRKDQQGNGPRRNGANGPKSGSPNANKPRNNSNGGQKAAGSTQQRQLNMKGLSPEQYAKVADVRQALHDSGFNPIEDDIIHALKQNNFDAAVTAQKLKGLLRLFIRRFAAPTDH